MDEKINYLTHELEQFQGDCKNSWKQRNNIIPANRINKNALLIK